MHGALTVGSQPEAGKIGELGSRPSLTLSAPNHKMATREGWSRKYIDPKKAAKSYWPNGMMSPSLKRAREPFRIPNIITGVGLSIFVVGVYTYSIRAVKQDEFEDVDNEARSRIRDRQRANAANLTVKEESELMEAAIRNVQDKKP